MLFRFQVNYLAAEMVAGEALAQASTIGDMEVLAMNAQREAAARAVEQGTDASMKRKFVPSTTQSGMNGTVNENENQANKIRAVAASSSGGNPDEIDIDDGGDGLMEKPVPLAVFGKAGMQ
jgi:hypothetical protein